METKNSSSNTWKDRKRSISVQLAFWALAYVITMAIASFGPKFLWDYNAVASLSAILCNLLVGLWMIIVNVRHLKQADELMKKIQLEAMGLALGIGIVVGLSYSLLDVTNVISSDAEIAYLVIVIGLIYLTSLVVNYRRYQ